MNATRNQMGDICHMVSEQIQPPPTPTRNHKKHGKNCKNEKYRRSINNGYGGREQKREGRECFWEKPQSFDGLGLQSQKGERGRALKRLRQKGQGAKRLREQRRSKMSRRESKHHKKVLQGAYDHIKGRGKRSWRQR